MSCQQQQRHGRPGEEEELRRHEDGQHHHQQLSKQSGGVLEFIFPKVFPSPHLISPQPRCRISAPAPPPHRVTRAIRNFQTTLNLLMIALTFHIQNW